MHLPSTAMVFPCRSGSSESLPSPVATGGHLSVPLCVQQQKFHRGLAGGKPLHILSGPAGLTLEMP